LRVAYLVLCVGCCLSAASGQWLEVAIAIPDTFGGLGMPNRFAHASIDNTASVADESTRAVFGFDALDWGAELGAAVLPIFRAPIGVVAWIRSLA
jgi:hypothetical protein